jgi:hypothetical protein
MDPPAHARVTVVREPDGAPPGASAPGRDLVPPALRARYEAAGQGHVFRYVDAHAGPVRRACAE